MVHMILLIIIYICLFLFLISTNYFEPLKKYHTFAKTLNSIGYIATAIYSYTVSKDSSFFFRMLPAFILCLLGDIFLSLPNGGKRGGWFYAGFISFALAHIVMPVAIISLADINPLEFILPVIMVIAVYVITRGPNFDMGNFTIPILIYGFLVAWTFSRSVVVMLQLGMSGRGIMLFAGSLLFMISDIIILFIYFYKKKVWWSSFANLFTYYSGMFLLAASIYFPL